jgi:putative transposase
MARPLSIDLRERAVAAVLKGGLSRHRAAAQFGVAASTVINWVRRFQETGSVAPGQMGGHKPKAIAGAPRLSGAADQGTRVYSARPGG